jgi:hypothetical protein
LFFFKRQLSSQALRELSIVTRKKRMLVLWAQQAGMNLANRRGRRISISLLKS